MAKLIQLSDADGYVYPQIAAAYTNLSELEGCESFSLSTAGTVTRTLVNGRPYLVAVIRLNSSDTGLCGLYLVNPYNGSASCIKTISASSAVTLSISALTLTITTTSNYVRVSILRLG